MVSSIGQADDTALISNDLVFLSHLLKLSNLFCAKSLVELSAEKTRLQCYSNSTRASIEADIDNLTNPIEINGTRIPFSQTASHVGIVRSTVGNAEALLDRFTAHQRSLGAVFVVILCRQLLYSDYLNAP